MDQENEYLDDQFEPNEFEQELIETPETSAMTDDELHAVIKAELDDAINYVDMELSPQRGKATRYYNGEPFGTEEEGRSHVVSTEVRDTVSAMMPSLMRIFAGSENVVEFIPQGPEDVEYSEQATDAVRYILMRDNPGFNVIYSAMKDALVRKTGVFKWWYDESVEVNSYTFTGLDEESLALLTNEPGIEIIELEQEPMVEGAEPQVDPMTGEPMPMPMVYEVKAKVRREKNKICVESVPPEEFLYDRRAVDLDRASMVAHRQVLTVSDLVAMGYDQEEMEEVAGWGDDILDTNDERYSRNPQQMVMGADRPDTAGKRVLYIELYLRVDYDGDGIAELRKLCLAGSAYKVLKNEPTDEVPFAILPCDPEPHTLTGLSVADKTMDLQEIKSEVLRGVMDSLAQSINPRTAVVEGQANIEDVLNNENGSIIRMRAPGMVQPLAQPFVGQAAFPVIEYLDSIKENRTGVSKASMGLAADSLQSSTKAAVSATISAAQGHIELIARIFAETGFRRLYRGLLRTFIKHQDKPRVMRLRGKWVPVDPRVWNSDMDVEVNVGLSAMSNEEKLQMLSLIAGKQEQIMQTLGAQNPLVAPHQYRATLAKIVELAGFKNVEAFIQQVPVDYKPPQPQQQPDPAMILAQIEQMKSQVEMQIKQQEFQLKREQAAAADDRERDKLDADIALKRAELELKFQADLSQMQANLNLDMQKHRDSIAAQVQQATAAQQNQGTAND